jgi:hypothetical protein
MNMDMQYKDIPSQKTLTSEEDLLSFIDDIMENNQYDDIVKGTIVKFHRYPIEVTPDRQIYILNAYSYEKHPPSIGHWIVLITEGKDALLYTCLGIIPKGLINYLIDQEFTHIMVDLRTHQKITSKSCGWYCIRYILEEDWRSIKTGTYLSIVPGKYSNISTALRNTDIFNKNEENDDDYDYD